ncbi:MAG TPA: glycosyltransferase [Flavobacterium sp.]|nr:glycosyltransferase [Flavobacterium sp.]
MLAIVIPYYRITFLEATLQSLALQPDKRFMVYIGDDASPDSPKEILAKFEGQINFQYQKFENNLGSQSLVKQWERCLAMTGDEKWVMILGDDDVLGDNAVAAFYNHQQKIEEQGINVIRFASVLIDENGHETSAVYNHPETEKSTDFLYKKETQQTRSSLGEYIFNKECLIKNGFHDFPLAWHSDDMAILQCSDFGNVFTINDAIAYIRVSSRSISGSETNVPIKKKATYLFYSELASHCSRHFTTEQKLKIVGKVEQYFFKHKNAKLFLKIAFWQLRQNGLVHLFKFLRRTYKN